MQILCIITLKQVFKHLHWYWQAMKPFAHIPQSPKNEIQEDAKCNEKRVHSEQKNALKDP